jgi:hypothetical protein
LLQAFTIASTVVFKKFKIILFSRATSSHLLEGKQNLGKKYFLKNLNFDWINMSINETVQKETEEKNNSKTKNNDPQDLLRTQISVLKSKSPIIDKFSFHGWKNFKRKRKSNFDFHH